MDIRHRARALAKLGLLPALFGRSVDGVFKQKYHGDVTLVPRFTTFESVGLKAVKAGAGAGAGTPQFRRTADVGD